ncbi:MAG: YraN family protein [Candidatus Omnitrophica bacterium]|nr:YraN family protein [Candidatus Omnitrophota bacterium]
MPTLHKQTVGQTGERIAENYLRFRGYKIIGRNVRTFFGEIDIIARHAATIVFIEVKTLTTDEPAMPLYSITEDKKTKLIQNALSYMKQMHCRGKRFRIDAIGINLDISGKAKMIKHIRGAVNMEGSYLDY